MDIKGIVECTKDEKNKFDKLYISRWYGNIMMIDCDKQNKDFIYEDDKLHFHWKDISIWILNPNNDNRKIYTENRIGWLKRVINKIWIEKFIHESNEDNFKLEEVRFIDGDKELIIPANKLIKDGGI